MLRSNNRIIIIAPHPDDEWIGCGCTILKSLDDNTKVKVLIITNNPKRRIRVSEQLAIVYDYELVILEESEEDINEERVLKFLLQHINNNDTVYFPDEDTHPTHRIISRLIQNNLINTMYQYCVYNNTNNLIKRLRNKLLYYIIRRRLVSFSVGQESFILNYKINEKNNNIIKFNEPHKRRGDFLREYVRG